MRYRLREYRNEDAAQVNRAALAAFEQFKSAYSDWAAFSRGIGNMSALAANGEIIVAQQENEIVRAKGSDPEGPSGRWGSRDGG